MAIIEITDNHAKRIYFAQHGLAVDKSIDAERPLSATGQKQTRIVAKKLAEANVTIAGILHSGKLRTAQTAELFAAELGTQMVTPIEHLSPNDNITLISKHLITDDILIIGHLPHLDKLLSYLLTGEQGAGIIRFQNSAVICLEKTDNRYQISWMLPAVINLGA